MKKLLVGIKYNFDADNLKFIEIIYFGKNIIEYNTFFRTLISQIISFETDIIKHIQGHR